MIDLKENKIVQEALKKRAPITVEAVFAALNQIKTIKFVIHGKRKSILINGKGRDTYYSEIGKNYVWVWVSKTGKEFPTEVSAITIRTVIEKVIMKKLNFFYDDFDKYYPNVKISHKTLPIISGEPKPNQPIIDLRKVIRTEIMKLNFDQLSETLDFIEEIHLRRVN